MKRSYKVDHISHAAVILGGDVARQGDDSSALARRQGQMMYPIRTMKIPDTMLVASQFGNAYTEFQADAIFVDATGGYGVGVVDAMRQTGYDPVEIYFSGKATDARYFNKRSQMYFDFVKWIRAGGALPPDPDLKEELCATTYTFQGDKFRLCDKDDIKAEIGRSPDKTDAAALTFAFPVVPSNPFGPSSSRKQQQEYDPYSSRN